MTDLFAQLAPSPTPPTSAAPRLRSSASVQGGRLITRCAVEGCDRPACLGEGYFGRRFRETGDRRHLGTWWCGVHWREHQRGAPDHAA